MAHHQVVQLPKLAQAGGQVVYQPPEHQGYIAEANAIAVRIGSEGMCDLEWPYPPDTSTRKITNVPFEPSGLPGTWGTWHEVGV